VLKIRHIAKPKNVGGNDMTTRLNIFITLFLTFQVGQSLACSCDDLPTVQESIKYSDAVVVGTFLSKEIIKVARLSYKSDTNFVNREFSVAQYKFLLQDNYKGSFSSDTLIIMTGLGSASCGIDFPIGLRYIIYGNNKSYFEHSNFKLDLPFSKNTIWTNSCSRTMYFNNFEKEKIAKNLKKSINKFSKETIPIFKNGGERGLKKFISKNIVYPDGVCVSGNVYTRFTVDITGHVKDIEILKGITESTDKESIRIINLLTFLPATKDGKQIETKMNLRVNFTIDNEDKK
jgi:hypothetical protein